MRVDSHNHVPTAAGLASSSSGFAALAFAARALFERAYPDEPHMSDTELSTFARRGSGSATRSILAVLWSGRMAQEVKILWLFLSIMLTGMWQWLWLLFLRSIKNF